MPFNIDELLHLVNSSTVLGNFDSFSKSLFKILFLDFKFEIISCNIDFNLSILPFNSEIIGLIKVPF